MSESTEAKDIKHARLEASSCTSATNLPFFRTRLTELFATPEVFQRSGQENITGLRTYLQDNQENNGGSVD